jgi:hypothetical protein
MSASTSQRGTVGALPRFSVAGLMLAFALAATLATAVGVAAWSLAATGPPPADELARARAVAYTRGQAVGYHAGRADGRHVGFLRGHRRGYRTGYRAGVRRGWRTGGALGRTDGYREGYAAGLAAAAKARVKLVPPTRAAGG